jgi:uncharacterized protein (TIGR02145 family)
MEKTFKIGRQVWMLENLNTDVFLNGDKILHAKTVNEWIEAGINNMPAWCYYNNDEKIGSLYGKLYNWFAVNDSRGIAPKGFHIPNNDDWLELINSYGDAHEAGDQMRCLKYWDEKWFGTDKEGFNALPGGYRSNGAGALTKNKDGSPLSHAAFYDKGKSCYLWSASNKNNTHASCYYLTSENVQLYNYSWYKGQGFSVRCIKNY